MKQNNKVRVLGSTVGFHCPRVFRISFRVCTCSVAGNFKAPDSCGMAVTQLPRHWEQGVESDCVGPDVALRGPYVFWGSGEMGPGVLVPSILWTGIWNWGVRTEGNWKR